MCSVILAPYSLSGVLTGVSYRSTDPGVQRILDDWKQYFPLSRRQSKKNNCNSSSCSDTGDDNGGDSNTRDGDSADVDSSAEEDTSVPPVVEIIIGKKTFNWLMKIQFNTVLWVIINYFYVYVYFYFLFYV